MKRRRIKDERIVAGLQKLNSHGFAIVFVGLMASLIVKLFILHWDMKYWLDTFLILMAACLYVTVRGIKGGLYLLPEQEKDVKRLKKMNIIGGVGSSLVWGILMFSYDMAGSEKLELGENISSTLAGTIVFFIGITGLQWVMIKRSNENADKPLD